MTNERAREPAPRRKVREDRRQEIIDVAAQLGLTEGLSSITARRVAMRIGVQFSLVTHYFTPIDALIAAAFTQLASAERDAGIARADGESTPTDRLRVCLAAYTAPTRDPMGLLWLDAWRQASDRPRLRQAVIDQMERDVTAMEEVIAAGVATGEFRVSDPSVAAIRILALLDGQSAVSAIRTALTESSLKYPAVEEMVFANAERELGLPPGSLAS